MVTNTDLADGTVWHFARLRKSLRRWSLAAASAMAHYAETNPLPDNPFEAIGRQSEQAFLVPEWREVKHVVDQDPNLAAQVGHAVGTALWVTPLDIKDVGYQFINAMLYDPQHRNGAGYEIDENFFDELYAPIDSFLGSPTIEYTATAIILGLESESVPIILDEGIRIDLVDVETDASDLASSLMQIAYQQVARGIGELDIPKHYQHGVVKRFSLPKGPYDNAEAATVYADLERDRQNALSAIAACTPSYVIPWPPRVTENGWRHGRSSVKLGGPQMLWRLDVPGALIRDEDKSLLLRAWHHLRNPSFTGNNANILIALNRLAWLGTRLSYEDRLVDAMIAAEAFFISGSTAEIAYRLAMNAAVLGKRIRPDVAPRLIYDFVKVAYTIRSKIVHGAVLSSKDYRFKRKDIGIAAFLSDTVDIVRLSIAWALKTFEPGEKIKIEWEEIALDPESMPHIP